MHVQVIYVIEKEKYAGTGYGKSELVNIHLGSEKSYICSVSINLTMVLLMIVEANYPYIKQSDNFQGMKLTEQKQPSAVLIIVLIVMLIQNIFSSVQNIFIKIILLRLFIETESNQFELQKERTGQNSNTKHCCQQQFIFVASHFTLF